MSSDAQNFYRSDIDGLRAIAIISVVAYHVRIPGVTGGFVGVDVFFVLSGFLITSLLVAEIRRNGALSLSGFYARRVRRLFPALIVVVMATCLIGAFALLPVFGQQQELARSAIATALYVSNFYFWKNSPGYFDQSADLMPLLHTWSLAVEEQFYLAWPLMIVVVMVAARRWNWRFERTLLILTAAILVASLGWCIWRTQDDPTAAFYLLPSRAWQLATGAALALWLPTLARERPVAGTLCSVAGVLAIGAAAVTLHEDMPVPGYLATLPVFGTALVVAGGHLAQGNPVQSVLSSRPMVLIGLLSYSWYLWHWPLLALSRAYVLEEHNPARDLAVVLVSLLLAYASYRLVENPIRYGRPGPFRRNGTTLVTGLAVSLALCLPAAALLARANREAEQPRFAALGSAKEDRPSLRAICHQEAPFESLTPASKCISGDPGRTPRLLLWGDSHADHLSPLMQAFAAWSPGTPTLARSFPRCPPFATYEKRDPREQAACDAFNAAVFAEARTLRARGLEGVILSGHWLRVFGAPRVFQVRGERSEESPALRRPELASSLADTVERLSGLGLRVLIVAPLPEMPYDVPACLARRRVDECNVSRALFEAQRREVMSLLAGIQERNPDVRILDLIDSVCDASTCFAERNGTILYVDDDHLTATASRGLLPIVRESLLLAAGNDHS
jgi:peptidoglycan/LPS O-acetylase OafA/YrhL